MCTNWHDKQTMTRDAHVSRTLEHLSTIVLYYHTLHIYAYLPQITFS